MKASGGFLFTALVLAISREVILYNGQGMVRGRRPPITDPDLRDWNRWNVFPKDYDSDRDDFFLSPGSVYRRIRPDWLSFKYLPSRALYNLNEYIEPDIQDYCKALIRDILFKVTYTTGDTEVTDLPGQSATQFAVDSNYFRGKFERKSLDGTRVILDPPRRKLKRGMSSSFGLTQFSVAQYSDEEFCGSDVEAGEPVECIFRTGGLVECEWRLGLRESDTEKIYAILLFKTQYETVNDTLCVRERQYTASMEAANFYNQSVDRDTLKNINVHFHYISIIKLFRRVEMSAELFPQAAAGIMNLSSECNGNGSDCRCSLRLYDDPSVLHKALQMMHMGLSSVLEDGVSVRKYNPRKERQYPDFLLHWNSMTSLDVSGLPLKSINEEYFEKVPNLVYVNLANTGLSEVPEGLTFLDDLQSLSLAGNTKIQTSDLAKVLHSFNMLRALDLSNIPLQEFDLLEEVLTSMHLETLYLRNCQLTALNIDFFHQQYELVNLSLSGNRLGRVPRDLVKNMTKLKSLELSSIDLEDGPDLLVDNIELNYLDLSNNKISSIGNIITSGLVIELNLSGNRIGEWDDIDIFVLKERPWAKIVNLANNKIAVLTKIMGKSLGSLTQVDLTGNPFDCNDCRVHGEMKRWLLSYEGGLVIIDNGRVSGPRCGTPPERQYMPVLETFIPKKCKSDTPNLLWLLVIPVVVFSTPLFIYSFYRWRYRLELKHITYMKELKLKSRRRGAVLYEKHFEYDVYLVYSPEDSNFASSLKARLENHPRRYRVLVSSRREERVSDEVLMCRHVVVVVTHNLARTEYCHRAVERTNFWMLSGDFHNFIMLMVEGVNLTKLSTTVQMIHSMHDHIDWPTSGPSDDREFRRLVNYMGPSNYETWQIALRNSGEPEAESHPSSAPYIQTYALRMKNALFSSIGLSTSRGGTTERQSNELPNANTFWGKRGLISLFLSPSSRQPHNVASSSV